MHKNQIAAADHHRTHSIMRRKSGGMAGIRHMTALLKEAASLIPDYPGFEALCADSLLHAWESDRCTGKRELHNRHRARGAGSGLMRMNWKGWQCVRSGAVRLSGREVAAQRLQHARAAAQAGGAKSHPPPAGEAHGLDLSRDRWPKTGSHQRFSKEG